MVDSHPQAWVFSPSTNGLGLDELKSGIPDNNFLSGSLSSGYHSSQAQSEK